MASWWLVKAGNTSLARCGARPGEFMASGARHGEKNLAWRVAPGHDSRNSNSLINFPTKPSLVLLVPNTFSRYKNKPLSYAKRLLNIQVSNFHFPKQNQTKTLSFHKNFPQL
jgi:hypothetical protein